MNYTAEILLPVINGVPYLDFVKGSSPLAAVSQAEQVIDLYFTCSLIKIKSLFGIMNVISKIFLELLCVYKL